MSGETLTSGTDYFRPFPDARDVFSRDVEQHAEFLLPAATLRLNHICPDWDGDIHFLLPVEPVDGYGRLGERSTDFHNYLCRPDWLGYRLIGDKCELLCDFRYFHKALFAWRPPTDELEKHEAGAVPAFYKKTHNYFDCAKEYYAQHGFLYGEYGSDSTSEADAADETEYHRSLVTNLGGVSHDGNWSGTAHQLVARYSIPETRLYRVVPKTEDGRDFAFIGEVPMWTYIRDTNGSLLLFYDPQERIALTIIDWS